jgi:predicted phosphodiesterase
MPLDTGVTDDELIMFVGDTHGDVEHWLYLFEQSFEYPEPVRTFVQVGDFGYWEHNMTTERYEAALAEHGVEYMARVGNSGAAYLDYLNFCLVAAGAWLIWVDGNHDNIKLLEGLYAPGKPRYQSGGAGMWKVRDRIIFVPRGTAWVWGETKFLGIGGAFSVDQDHTRAKHEKGLKRDKYRLQQGKPIHFYEGISNLWEEWWPEETISDDERDKARAIGSADVVISHDAPGGVDLQLEFIRKHKDVDFRNDTETLFNRNQLEQIRASANPANWIHGHHHIRYSQYVTNLDKSECRVIGLDRNEHGAGSFLVATPEELRDPRSRIV